MVVELVGWGVPLPMVLRFVVRIFTPTKAFNRENSNFLFFVYRNRGCCWCSNDDDDDDDEKNNHHNVSYDIRIDVSI